MGNLHQSVVLCLASPLDAVAISGMSAELIEHGLPQMWTALRVCSHIRHRESTVLIAKQDSGLLGFAIMQFGDSTAHLNLLAVARGARRRGVGRQLLVWLHDSALAAGTFTVNLELRADNIEARRFYEAMGYKEHGYMPRYYSGVEDAIRMTCNLTVRTAP